MATATENNLLIDSGGFCFLCLNEPEQKFSNKKKSKSPKTPNAQSSNFSINEYQFQCISRYLKMDLEKVLLEESANTAKSNLKVSLCRECGSLTENLSGLYRQLEKIRIEMTFLLNKVHQKMVKAEGKLERLTDRKDQTRRALALRNETEHKCIAKLSKARPRVKLSRMNIFTPNFPTIPSVPDLVSPPNVILLNTQVGSEMETDPLEDQDSFIADMLSVDIKEELEANPESNPLATPFNEEPSLEALNDPFLSIDVHEEIITADSKPVPSTFDSAIPSTSTTSDQTFTESSPSEFRLNRDQWPYVKKRHHSSVRNTSRISSQTCNLCGEEVTRLDQHKRLVHFHASHTCTLCDMKFNCTSNLKSHLQVAHFGQRHTCDGCGNTYVQELAFRLHKTVCLRMRMR